MSFHILSFSINFLILIFFGAFWLSCVLFRVAWFCLFTFLLLWQRQRSLLTIWRGVLLLFTLVSLNFSSLLFLGNFSDLNLLRSLFMGFLALSWRLTFNLLLLDLFLRVRRSLLWGLWLLNGFLWFLIILFRLWIDFHRWLLLNSSWFFLLSKIWWT